MHFSDNSSHFRMLKSKKTTAVTSAKLHFLSSSQTLKKAKTTADPQRKCIFSVPETLKVYAMLTKTLRYKWFYAFF